MAAVWFGPAALAAEPLVTPEWVAERLNNDNIVFLDVRSKRSYARGHIPGAFHTDLTHSGWLETANDRTELPTLQALANVISRHGISNESHVVLISRGAGPDDMAAATSIYWLLKYVGHQEVSILNGGMRAFRTGVDVSLSDVAGEPKAQRYRAVKKPELLATAEDAMGALGVSGLIDHRDSAAFVGLNKVDFVHRAGSIPGAKNVPAGWLLSDGRGLFRTAEEMRQIFKFSGIATDKVMISFGDSLRLGSLGWFASHEIMGNADAKLYFGSMGEWAADEAKPVVTRLSFD